jgi:aryl-alcohol dehydrogenase-like predicted oxidoreductase
VQDIANKNNATPAQIALAWLLKQGNDIVPIPGTKHVKYLEENAKAVDLKLPNSTWNSLDQVLQSIQIAGERYPESALKAIDRTE